MKCLLVLIGFCASAFAEKSPEMQTRILAVPTDFFSFEYRGNTPEGAPYNDPFAPPAGKRISTTVPRETARSFLETQGVGFPEGSVCFFDRNTGLLTVRSTPATLDLIQTVFAEAERQQPGIISLRVHIMEAPISAIRELEKQQLEKSDCTEALARLLSDSMKSKSHVRILADASLQGEGGRKLTHESVIQAAFCESLTFDSKRRLSVPYSHGACGLVIEAEPVIGPDQRTIELNYNIALHPGLPRQREIIATDPSAGEKAGYTSRDFMIAHFASSTSMSDGTTRFLEAVPAPALEGKPDQEVVWGLFVSAQLSKPRRALPRGAKPHSLDAGLHMMERAFPRGLLESHVRAQLWTVGASEEAPADQLSAYLRLQGIPLAEKSVVKIQEDGRIRFADTLENIERLQSLLDELLRHESVSLRHVLQIIEAPESALRRLSDSAHQHFDHQEEWREISKLLTEGRASIIDTVFVANKPCPNASFRRGRDHAFIDGFNTSPDGLAHLTLSRWMIGTRFVLEPRTDDAKARVMDYELETHPAPQKQRYATFHDPSTARHFELPFTDLHLARLFGACHARGGVQMLSAWQPAGRADLAEKKLLHAAFLRTYETRLIPQPPKPAEMERIQKDINLDAWDTRIFRVPPDFLSASAAQAAPPADPFDSVSSPSSRAVTAKEVLEGAGITFPKGATAVFIAKTGTLVVKNSIRNLHLIETYTEELRCGARRSIVLTAHVIEAGEKELLTLMENCLPLGDQRAEWLKLESRISKGEVTRLGTLRVETRGGVAATARQVREHTHIIGLGVSEAGNTSFTTEKREVGFVFQAEPTIGPDGQTVELNIKLHHDNAPPEEHREHIMNLTTGKMIEVPLSDFHSTELETGVTILNGTTQLIGLWRAASGRYQAVFLSCDLISAL